MISQKGKIVSSMNEKYNVVLHRLKEMNEGNHIVASDVQLNHDEFEDIINELENDGIIKKGEWSSGDYFTQGLTFKGRSFIENNDNKEYHKIEKTEIHNNLNIHGDNKGVASIGNNNVINNSEFNQKFTQLIQEIQNSNIENKTKIIQELNEKKEDKKALQALLGTLLTRGAEIVTIYPFIVTLLGMLQ